MAAILEEMSALPLSLPLCPIRSKRRLSDSERTIFPSWIVTNGLELSMKLTPVPFMDFARLVIQTARPLPHLFASPLLWGRPQCWCASPLVPDEFTAWRA